VWQATIRAPSVLLPLLKKWYEIFAHQYCPIAKQKWLARKGPREKYEKLLTEVKMGRIHDEGEAYMALHDGTFKVIRPQTSSLEAFHEREIRNLGPHNSRTGIIIGGLLMLAQVLRNNIPAAIKYRGERDFGAFGAGFFRYRVISVMQDFMKQHPQIFPPNHANTKFADGDVSTLPDTGELFASFWKCNLWDTIRRGGEPAAHVLNAVVERHAESEACPTIRESDIRIMIATINGDFASFLRHQFTGTLAERMSWEVSY
jgi:hypothetical protein